MVSAVDPDGVLASDAEREHAVEHLNTAFSEGRLSPDEFNDRVSRALAARTRADLAGLLADLPLSKPLERRTATKRPLAKRVAAVLASCVCCNPRLPDRESDGAISR